jgi:hypothetical protein
VVIVVLFGVTQTSLRGPPISPVDESKLLLTMAVAHPLPIFGHSKGNGSERFWNAGSKHCVNALPFLYFNILLNATLT